MMNIINIIKLLHCVLLILSNTADNYRNNTNRTRGRRVKSANATSVLCCPLVFFLVVTETIRIKYFLDLLVNKRHPVMLVGNAGCGKTVLVRNILWSLVRIPTRHDVKVSV